MKKWTGNGRHLFISGLLMLLCFDVLIIPSRLRPAGGPDNYLHTQPVHHDPCLNIIMPLIVELARALSISDLVCQSLSCTPSWPENLAVIVWTH